MERTYQTRRGIEYRLNPNSRDDLSPCLIRDLRVHIPRLVSLSLSLHGRVRSRRQFWWWGLEALCRRARTERSTRTEPPP